MCKITDIKIKESADELKDLMHQQSNAEKKTKLQVLYILKAEIVKDIQLIASIIGKNRTTVYRWLNIYKEHGLNGFLNGSSKKKPGRKSQIPQEIIREISQRKRQFNSYGEIQDWLKTNHSLVVNYHVIQELIRYRLKIKIGACQ